MIDGALSLSTKHSSLPNSSGLHRGREMHRAWIEINLRNLVSNGLTLLRASSPSGLLAVVKADAYGVGAVQVVRALQQLHPWGFAVATIDEAIVLRNGGIDGRILVLQPAQMAVSDWYREFALIATIDHPDLVDRWPTEFHVAIDTGMCREGICWSESFIGDLNWRRAAGVFTHMHAADSCSESVRKQYERFRSCLSRLPQHTHLVRHAANSAAVWRQEEKFDLVRPGLFLYGGIPGADSPLPEPVVTVKSRITSMRTVKAGETIGYGFDHRAQRDTVIATIGIGYADGVPLSLRHAEVLINGVRCPIAGRVTMDMIMVDVGECRVPPAIGDPIVLIGSDGHETITLGEFSHWAATMPYDILTRLSPRLPRVYNS